MMSKRIPVYLSEVEIRIIKSALEKNCDSFEDSIDDLVEQLEEEILTFIE